MSPPPRCFRQKLEKCQSRQRPAKYPVDCCRRKRRTHRDGSDRGFSVVSASPPRPRVLTVTIPPSPQTWRFFNGWRLKQPKSPKLPTSLPPKVAPTAWAASSIRVNPRRLAIKVSLSIAQGFPVRCTARIAFVRRIDGLVNLRRVDIVIPAHIDKNRLGSNQRNSRSTCDKRIRNRNDLIPRADPSRPNERMSASSPEFTPTAKEHPASSANFFSNPPPHSQE